MLQATPGIQIEVTSDGRTGKDFIRMLGQANRVSDCAKSMMKKPVFVSTNGVTYDLRVIHGSEFDHDPTTAEICALAESRGWRKPAAEVAPLLCEKLSDADLEKMGVRWLAVMHEPIIDSGGFPSLLGVGRGDEGRWLGAGWVSLGHQWGRRTGWAFLAPQE